jgi:hypothetical protein
LRGRVVTLDTFFVARRNQDALQTGLDAIDLRLHGSRDVPAIFRRERVLNSAWLLAEQAIKVAIPGRERFTNIVEALGTFDPLRAARLAVRQLVGDRFSDHAEAERVLTSLAKNAAEPIMEALGEVMLEEKTGGDFTCTASSLLSVACRLQP